MRRILKSQVRTNDDSIVFDLGRGDKTVINWTDINYAGITVEKFGKPRIFVYAEEHDQLMTIPDEFDNFAGLAQELREKTPFEEVRLAEDETIQDYLRKKVVPESKEEDSTP